MNLSPSKGFNIFYNLYLQQLIKCIKEKESSICNSEQERESLSSDESSSDWEENTSYVVSKDEGEGIEEKSIIKLDEKEKTISNHIQGEEHLRFISLLSKIPKVFINNYSHIKGEDGMKHHIKLKESIPIAQTLQQLESMQKKDLKALLQESFVYQMEDSKCMSPIIVVLKQKDITFQPLIDSNKQDDFSLPFRDEIVDEIVVYTKQVRAENVMCLEGVTMDESKII